MAHNAKIWAVAPTDGVSTLTSAQAVALDLNAYKAINGDDGGTWAPSAAIVIGGQGINPTLAVGAVPNFAADPSGLRTKVRRRLFDTPAKVVNFATTPQGYQQATASGGYFYLNLDNFLTDGATLTSITLAFKIPVAHVGMPAVKPTLSIARLAPMTGSSVSTTLLTADTGSNQLITAAVTVAAYEAAGANQTYVYTPDRVNVIDATQYSYLLTLIDESGVNALANNQYSACTLTMTYADLRPA